MTTTTFKTKEQYFAFRAAWAVAVNSEKAKSRLEPADEWLSGTDTYPNGTGRMRVSGWINAEHSILFNLLCGKPFDNGFTPVTNAIKLQNKTLINHGLYFGLLQLSARVKTAAWMVSHVDDSDTCDTRLTTFLKPFNGTVTTLMLASLVLPKIAPLYSSYGKSKQVANEIIAGNFKPTNFQQVYAAIEQVI